ncbi:MAG: dihydroxyacetone kinase subunit L [Thermoproteales archaeon]|nr:dihydroxyacetone kinase subunit L [Thermoproteales archaeon]
MVIPTGEVLTSEDIYNIIFRILDVIKENEKYLTDLDAAIGDADHGINMVRGFSLATERLKDLNPSSDVGTILNTVAMALLETVGGAAGPLYGMWFMNMSQKAMGKNEVDKKLLAEMLEAGLKGVQDIGGGTQPGEKTMVDAIYPALEELKKAVEDESVSLVEALKKATEAAEKGMKATIPMIAKRGRASYLGERSRGHQDPGATSSYLIIKTFYEYVKEKKG